MSFALAYRLWSAELLAEYTKLLIAVQVIGILPADSITPHSPVAVVLADVYEYARRSRGSE